MPSRHRPAPEPLVDRPGHLIRRLQQIAHAIFIEQAREFDVTPVQYAALFAINDHPGIDQTALCNIIAYDRSTIGDVVGRLERKKLIKRQSGPLDRRRKFLSITPLGHRLIYDIEPAVAAAQRLMLAPLEPSERRTFMQMLRQLVHLNNAHSRAPQWPKDARPPRLRAGQERQQRKGRAGAWLRAKRRNPAAGT